MLGWNSLVGAIAAILCTLSQIYGGNLGMAILTISLLVRLALLPLTLRMARHAQSQQVLMHRLKDQIASLKTRYKSNPQRLATEMAELYRKNGVEPINGRNLAGGVLQLAVGTGLYSAIRRGVCSGGRFLWIRNLGQPDPVLVALTAVVTFISSAIAPHVPEQNRIVTSVLPTVMTLILAWRLSSAVMLYWTTSTAVNAVQSWILRRNASVV
ncbi:MAG TPA: membrane protein insertase YidC [Candidatus Angelobacter sp.]|nr:membrane protein insertase YidC [Candidatus Angelobacter sp.]